MLPGLLPAAQGGCAGEGRGQHVGWDFAGGGWDGAREVKGQLAQGYWWVENLVGLDESFLRELEIQEQV